MRNVLAIDVSRYEERLNGDELKAGGVGLIIAKCSSGTNADRNFVKHGLEAARVGIPFAAYHWGDPTVDAAAQVDFCLQTIKGVGVPILAVALDIEQWWADWSLWSQALYSQIPWTSVPRIPANKLNGFYYDVFNRLSREMEAIAYTSRSFVMDSVPTAAPWLAQSKLWLAQYGRQPKGGTYLTWEEVREKWLPTYTPLAPAGTPPENIIGHQFSGDCMWLPGVYDALGRRSALDVNVFDDAWVAKITGGATLEPAIPVVPVKEAKPIYSAVVTALSGLNVRATPLGTKVGALACGAKVDVWREVGGWAQIDASGSRWISATYLSKVSDVGNPLYSATVNVTAGLNVRSTPGGDKVSALRYNTPVSVWAEQNGWAQIDQTGNRWVSVLYLTR
jgi:hypothetical protein